MSCKKTDDGKKEMTEADKTFIIIADDYISGYLTWRPGEGVGLGLHEYDGRIRDFSRASVDAELRRLKGFENKLSQLDTASMSPQILFDYRVLAGSVRESIFWLEDADSYRKNPMGYASALDVNIYIQRNFAPIEERVKSVISILNQAPKVFESARKNLADSLARPFIETAIQIAKGSVTFLTDELTAALKGVKNDSLMEAFRKANRTAVNELNAYTVYLQKEKLPKAHSNYALGREKYLKMLDYGELIALSPEKILEIGMNQLRKEQELFSKAARIIDADKTPAKVYAEIKKDHPTADSLIPDSRKNMEAIRQFLIDRKIVTVPSEVRVKIEETPQYQRATSFASMDTPGPFEIKATEAYYYITPVEKDWTAKQKEEWLTAFNYYTTDIVTIHEAYPGHYTQFLHLNASDASKVGKIFGSYAFIEGWAHYTEQMMVDEGYGSDKDSITEAKYRIAQLDESLLRLCRLCVSIKMHCQGMTIEEATKFFMDNCYYEEQPAKQEAVRGTYDPGYLFYSLGKLMILKLREDYKKQEGNSFTLQKFHDAMLSSGMPPLPLLREVMIKDKPLLKEIL